MSGTETNAGQLRYWAFISYSQHDAAWAKWLHRELESYRVPRDCIGRRVESMTVARRLVPIFRDREELASAGDLSATIEEALTASSALVVICSPYAAASPWVDKEVRAFKVMGRSRRIFPIIVDGEPYASDRPVLGLPECFPPALRYAISADGRPTRTRADPLAADAREGKDGPSNARLKLIAGILGVGFDQLRRREQVRQRQRRLRMAAIASACLVALGLVYAGLADADAPIPGGDGLRARIDRQGLSLFRPVATSEEIARQAALTRSQIRRRIIDTAITVKLARGDNPIAIWDIAQAVASVYRDPDVGDDELAVLRPLLAQAFRADMIEFDGGRRVGWRDSLTLSRGETPLWMMMALAGMLARSGGESSERARLVEYLDITQEIAENYSPLNDGGWNIVREEKPENHHIYTTALALHALLELHAKGMCWRGDCEQVVKRIQATSSWLIRAFDQEDQIFGWRRRLGDDKPPDPDLSIFIYAALGRASMEVGLELPDVIARQALMRLVGLRNRTYFPAQQDIEHWVRYVDRHGNSQRANTPTRVLWYPWSIEALVHWTRLAERAGLPAENVQALRRSMSHIVVNLAETARLDLSRALLFVQAETHYGIGALGSTRPRHDR